MYDYTLRHLNISSSIYQVKSSTTETVWRDLNKQGILLTIPVIMKCKIITLYHASYYEFKHF